MADITKLNINGTDYNIKDEIANVAKISTSVTRLVI